MTHSMAAFKRRLKSLFLRCILTPFYFWLSSLYFINFYIAWPAQLVIRLTLTNVWTELGMSEPWNGDWGAVVLRWQPPVHRIGGVDDIFIESVCRCVRRLRVQWRRIVILRCCGVECYVRISLAVCMLVEEWSLGMWRWRRGYRSLPWTCI